jgi:hypothetical protein
LRFFRNWLRDVEGLSEKPGWKRPGDDGAGELNMVGDEVVLNELLDG